MEMGANGARVGMLALHFGAIRSGPKPRLGATLDALGPDMVRALA